MNEISFTEKYEPWVHLLKRPDRSQLPRCEICSKMYDEYICNNKLPSDPEELKSFLEHFQDEKRNQVCHLYPIGTDKLDVVNNDESVEISVEFTWV